MTTLSGPSLMPTSGSVKRLLILLHGVGSNGDDLISLSPMIQDVLPDTLFVSPHGAEPYDMAPFGYQWFSLRDRSVPAMTAGVQAVAPRVNQYIDQMRDQYSLRDDQVAVMGFSQGTMTALFAGLRRAQPLAGIVGFCGALLSPETLPRSATPVCLIHGEHDEVVPFFALAHAEAGLKAAGISVETHPRPGLGHTVDAGGLDAAVAFLRRCYKL